MVRSRQVHALLHCVRVFLLLVVPAALGVQYHADVHVLSLALHHKRASRREISP
jgi:hypothetical protein